ncbi:hypothetical protein PAXRUDRAFT_822475 [Paxillus rubicundulus Ve08.2h10]|uniref:Uncharacterized protein n=1 Tax=Paxillus rubicundulus Ve08.2h10 TaxID=930991 RepID=A0A0D0E9T3_9AGAM|nr:hypothetical protein PAXRUDRAFT_822475 [Paxillus rubicundulus Ve08.2h10]
MTMIPEGLAMSCQTEHGTGYASLRHLWMGGPGTTSLSMGLDMAVLVLGTQPRIV